MPDLDGFGVLDSLARKPAQPMPQVIFVTAYDEYALEEAIRLKEKSGGDVTVLTFGPERAQQALGDREADRVAVRGDFREVGRDLLRGWWSCVCI